MVLFMGWDGQNDYKSRLTEAMRDCDWNHIPQAAPALYLLASYLLKVGALRYIFRQHV